MLAYGRWLIGDPYFLDELPDHVLARLTSDRPAHASALEIGRGNCRIPANAQELGSEQPGAPVLRLYTDGEWALSKLGQAWWIEVEGLVTTHWRSGEHRLTYRAELALTPSLWRYYMLQTILPVMQEIEGDQHIYHAGAVAHDGGAVMLVGNSGAGKSTLTHACLRAGVSFLADDRIPLFRQQDGPVHAVASYPFCRPYRAYPSLGDFVEAHSRAPVALRTALVLEPAVASAEVSHKPLTASQKFSALQTGRGVRAPFLEARHFAFTAALCQEIDIYSLTVPRALERLPEVVEFIIQKTRTTKI